MIEGLGSSPIGFEQKENLLKMEDEKSSVRQVIMNVIKLIKECAQLNYLLLL